MTNDITLHHISVSEMDNNCYLLAAGEEGLLIDAADDAAAIFKMAENAGVKITKVLTTHRHWDHVRALEVVLKKTGAAHYSAFLDAPALPAAVDVELNHDDVIEFGGREHDVIILRGHTPGGVCLAVDLDGVPQLFAGDSLFPGGVGKTTSEGDFVRLYKDVTERLFDIYPDEAVVWPGHGKNTTLGDERPHLGDWWDRRW